MARTRKKQRSLIKDLAIQRVERLFKLADEEFGSHPERSDRYVFIARKIGMRYRVRLPGELKRRVCKRCYCYLVPGSNSRVRLRDNYVVITCLKCGNQMRYPYTRIKGSDVEGSAED